MDFCSGKLDLNLSVSYFFNMLNLKQKISEKLGYTSEIFKELLKESLDTLSYSILGFGEIRTYLHNKETSKIAEKYLLDECRLTSPETSKKLSEFANYSMSGDFVLFGIGSAKTISYSLLLITKNPIILLLILGSGLFEKKVIDDVYKNVISSSKSDLV